MYRNISCIPLLLALILPLLAAQFCQTVTIPITATATNKALSTTLSLASLTPQLLSSVLLLPSTLRIVSLTIKAVYCIPFPNPRSSTLQILIHGITYTSSYWDSLDTYSWSAYATTQGYATLAIDRPCNGASTRLQSIAECQIGLNAAAVHELVQAARLGTLPFPTPYSFQKVIVAGHSLGSVVANFHAQIYPDDADAYILTGFSGALVNGLSGIVRLDLTPAPVAADVGYLRIGSEAAQMYLFYHGQYDPALQHADFLRGGTLALGEAVTGLLGQLPAPAYTGSIFVLNGNEDTAFCQVQPLGGVLGMLGNCSAGPSQGVRGLYPAARAFGSYDVGDTGHCLNLHYSAREGYEAAHEFLREQGF